MDGSQELTDIQRFYKNTTVFLTGATGFIGKLFLEKILRALPVKKVFILVRKKKDVPIAKRVQEIFESPTFVYVSTGFSNCIQTEIKEKVYPARIKAEDLVSVCEKLDEKCLDVVTKTLIGDWPNTYTFTKQVTEGYIDRKARDIPICIVRPTIVVSTVSEPMTAFVDNVFTLAGFVLANGSGLQKISYDQPITLDIIPVDFVVNQCIAAGWQTGETFKPLKAEIPVYHSSSSMDNPISQDNVYELCDMNGREVPTIKIVSFPLYFRTTCKYNYLLLRVLLHNLPAYFLDLSLRIQGKPPRFSKAIAKLHKFQESYEYFTTHSLLFHTENTNKILRKMSFHDRKLFTFDITTLDWNEYFRQYVKGLRIYLLKDPLDTVPEGKKHYRKLKILFIAFLIIFTIIFYVVGKIFLFRILPVIFGICLHIIRSVIC